MGMGVYLHGAHPNMNLFEGNVMPGLAIDNGWGSSIYNTALRNRLTGIDEYNAAGINNFVQAITIGATNRFQNIIGNVMGTILDFMIIAAVVFVITKLMMKPPPPPAPAKVCPQCLETIHLDAKKCKFCTSAL